jgi:tritrans,polycis-undecaprenyl-diphosphate synthase [geranylgeranyl-diphosphate specific]
MVPWFGRVVQRAYERLLIREIDGVPAHVPTIQDGNRRYARERGRDPDEGHREGAETAKQVLEWCEELGIEELTLYAFSTENFDRPPEERRELFDLIETKLRSFADREEVHERGVCIRAIGRIERLPERVRDAVAERRTADHDRLRLNVALAYGGRAQLLDAARDVAAAVERGDLDPEAVDVAAVEERLPDPTRDVDLIIRTGGDERTSNFLPWHANGNEAAAYFCTPYWPEFRKVDFLRSIRTYEAREESWRETRARRAYTLVRALGTDQVTEARRVLGRFKDALPKRERTSLEEDTEFDSAD